MRISSIERDVQTSMEEGSVATIHMSPKVFKVLTDLYSKKLESIIREVMANCYDAHISVGLNIPFITEVVTSGDNSIIVDESDGPQLRFRDFGPGISKEDMLKVYLDFFRSTKNDSNSQIGAFGLGAKSPWCYTTAYTVKSYQHGIVCTHALYMDAEGYPRCVLVSEELTEEPTGLEVLVPLNESDVYQANMLIQHLSIGYQLNGTLNKPKLVKPIEILQPIFQAGDLKLYKSRDFSFTSGNVLILYGVTIYELDQSVLNSIIEKGSVTLKDAMKDLNVNIRDDFRDAKIILNLPLGTLDLVPSRESLSYDERSLNMLTLALEAKAEQYVRWFKDNFENRSSLRWMNVSSKFRNFFQKRAADDLEALDPDGFSGKYIIKHVGCDTNEKARQSEYLRGFVQYVRNCGKNKKFFFIEAPIYPKVPESPTLFETDDQTPPDTLKYWEDVKVYKTKMMMLRAACNRARKIASTVTKEAAAILQEAGYRITPWSEIESAYEEIKAQRKIIAAEKRRSFKGLFAIEYAALLDRKKVHLACNKALIHKVDRKVQIAKLNRIMNRNKLILMFRVDGTGPTVPETGDFERKRSSIGFSNFFEHFMRTLLYAGVVRNDDVLCFYVDKQPPIPGLDGWSVIKSRWEARKLRLDLSMGRATYSILKNKNQFIRTMLGEFKIKIDSLEDFHKAAEFNPNLSRRYEELDDRMTEIQHDDQPIQLNGKNWLSGYCSKLYEKTSELSEVFQREVYEEYPMLSLIQLNYLGDIAKEKVKEYIKFVNDAKEAMNG